MKVPSKIWRRNFLKYWREENASSIKVSESTHRWAIADIFKAKVYKFFDPDAKVREISDKDVILAYCLPKVENQNEGELFALVCHRKPLASATKSPYFRSSYSGYETRASSIVSTHDENELMVSIVDSDLCRELKIRLKRRDD